MIDRAFITYSYALDSDEVKAYLETKAIEEAVKAPVRISAVNFFGVLILISPYLLYNPSPFYLIGHVMKSTIL